MVLFGACVGDLSHYCDKRQNGLIWLIAPRETAPNAKVTGILATGHGCLATMQSQNADIHERWCSVSFLLFVQARIAA